MRKESRKFAFQLAYASSIGISMVLAIFGCLFLGRWLDGLWGTAPYLTVIFLLIGIAAGFRNLYVLVKRFIRDDQPPSDAGKK